MNGRRYRVAVALQPTLSPKMPNAMTDQYDESLQERVERLECVVADLQCTP